MDRGATIIVDASVAIKWFFVEDDSPQALQLLQSGNLTAPDLLLMECRNAALNKFRRRAISRAEAVLFERNFLATRLSIVASGPFLPHAFHLALDLSKPIYDCVYLAAAIEMDAPLITADARFAEVVARSGVGAAVVQLLPARGL